MSNFKQTESGIIIPDSTIKRFQEGFIEVGAYKDLPAGGEVITTSGETITPYFLNTEKLLRESNISAVLKAFENSPVELIKYANEQMEIHPKFKEEMELIAEVVNPYAKEAKIKDLYFMIAGGMRRDVIFSGPVAKITDLPHLSLFKTKEGQDLKDTKIEMLRYNRKGGRVSFNPSFIGDNYKALPLADLLTKGSSQYRIDTITGEEVGWIPHLRSLGITVEDALTIADRNEGGKERLKDIGVNTYAFMPVSNDFLEQVSSGNALDTAKEYNKNPRAWTENYLLENGVRDIMIKSFEKGQDDRVIKLVNNYRSFLEENVNLKDNHKGNDMLRQVAIYTALNKKEVYAKLFKVA